MVKYNKDMVSKIDPTTINSVYSGKIGCCCGCLGTHSDDAAAIKRVLRAIATKDGDIGGNEKFVSLDTASRRYIAYFA